jgi:hypothetical protein
MNNHTKKIIAYAGCAVLFIACVVCAVILGFRSGDQPKTLVQTAQAEQTVDLKIKGNKKSRIYHMKGCPNYDDISERNIVWFKTKAEAEAAGYRMAKNC